MDVAAVGRSPVSSPACPRQERPTPVVGVSVEVSVGMGCGAGSHRVEPPRVTKVVVGDTSPGPRELRLVHDTRGVGIAGGKRSHSASVSSALVSSALVSLRAATWQAVDFRCSGSIWIEASTLRVPTSSWWSCPAATVNGSVGASVSRRRDGVRHPVVCHPSNSNRPFRIPDQRLGPFGCQQDGCRADAHSPRRMSPDVDAATTRGCHRGSRPSTGARLPRLLRL